MRTAPLLLLLSLLCGCSSFPQKMTGQFNASKDFIVIKKDGALYWSSPGKTQEPMNFVGVGAPDRDKPQHLWLVIPSISPFLNTSVTFSDNYNQVTVDWGGPGKKAGQDRETVYTRTTGK